MLVLPLAGVAVLLKPLTALVVILAVVLGLVLIRAAISVANPRRLLAERVAGHSRGIKIGEG